MIKTRWFNSQAYFQVKEGYRRNYIQILLRYSSLIGIGLYLNNLLGWAIGKGLSGSVTCAFCAQGGCSFAVDMIWRVGASIPNVSTYMEIMDKFVDKGHECFLLGFSNGYYLISTLVAIICLSALFLGLRARDKRAIKSGDKIMPIAQYPKAHMLILFVLIAFTIILFGTYFYVQGGNLSYATLPVITDAYYSTKLPAFGSAALVISPFLVICFLISILAKNN